MPLRVCVSVCFVCVYASVRACLHSLRVENEKCCVVTFCAPEAPCVTGERPDEHASPATSSAALIHASLLKPVHLCLSSAGYVLAFSHHHGDSKVYYTLSQPIWNPVSGLT